MARPGEHPRADERIGVEWATGGTQRSAQGLAEAQCLPELMQGPNIPVAACGLEHRCLRHGFGAPDSTLQAVDEWLEIGRLELIDSPEAGHDALLHLAGRIPIAFDPLQVAPRTRLGDTRVQAITLGDPAADKQSVRPAHSDTTQWGGLHGYADTSLPDRSVVLGASLSGGSRTNTQQTVVKATTDPAHGSSTTALLPESDRDLSQLTSQLL